jgi:hypothetical protein
MRVKHKDVDVRISRRTLWVDLQAYPLSQVTRVQPLEFTPNRRRMVLTYGRKAMATAGLGVVGLIFLGCLGEAVPPAASVVFAAVMLAIFVAHIVRLVRGLTRPTLYVLSVATAGSPHAAVVSTDKALIHNLSRWVVDAIDNPSAEFEIRVDHIEIVQGDKVHGDKFGGDRVDGDKILEGWT